MLFWGRGECSEVNIVIVYDLDVITISSAWGKRG